MAQKDILIVGLGLAILAIAGIGYFASRSTQPVVPTSGSTECVIDDDCVVFGETGDCNCGCYNKDHLPSSIAGEEECLCQAPSSCECVEERCEGVFEQVTNFEECVEATGIIVELLETYPPQCRLGGAVFVEDSCQDEESNLMTISDAKEIAKSSECGEDFKDTYFCNENTSTWWIDLNMEREGCAPACVVNIKTRTAEINWRCTGLIPS